MAFILTDPMLAVPPGINGSAQWLIILVVWLTTFTIPALSLVMLKYTGNITSLKLHIRKERLVPFFYVTLFYGFTAYYFSSQMLITDMATGIFILVTLMIFMAAIITIYWKISVHSMGMGGVVGFLFVVSYMIPESSAKYLFLFSVLIAGLVVSARLELQAHTPAQAYVGVILGLFISFMIIFWF